MSSVVTSLPDRRATAIDVEPGVPTISRPVRLLYSVVEAGELLNISKSSVYDLIETGDLPKVMVGKTGKTIRIAATDLQAYIDNQRVVKTEVWAVGS